MRPTILFQHLLVEKVIGVVRATPHCDFGPEPCACASSQLLGSDVEVVE